MYLEVPELKRCCFCFPLRYGLLFWGYIKVIFTAVPLIFVVERNVRLTMRGDVSVSILVMVYLVAFLFLMDVSFNTMLVFAAHKKNLKMLTIYQYYAKFFFLFIFALLLLDLMTYFNILMATIKVSFFYLSMILPDLVIGFLFVVIHGYVIILVRSEIMKLGSGRQFSFVNHAAEELMAEVIVDPPRTPDLQSGVLEEVTNNASQSPGNDH